MSLLSATFRLNSNSSTPPFTGRVNVVVPDTLPDRVNLSNAFFTWSLIFIFLTNLTTSSLWELKFPVISIVESSLSIFEIIMSPPLTFISASFALSISMPIPTKSVFSVAFSCLRGSRVELYSNSTLSNLVVSLASDESAPEKPDLNFRLEPLSCPEINASFNQS